MAWFMQGHLLDSGCNHYAVTIVRLEPRVTFVSDSPLGCDAIWVRQISTDISQKPAAFIFRVETWRMYIRTACFSQTINNIDQTARRHNTIFIYSLSVQAIFAEIINPNMFRCPLHHHQGVLPRYILCYYCLAICLCVSRLPFTVLFSSVLALQS
jgi:hypothetical protein